MNITIKDKVQCCGCTACANVCPCSAITMVSDSLGFIYPVVCKDKCTDCGLCVEVCQFTNDYKTYSDLDNIEIYGVRNKDKRELIKSQSGAAFYTIAKELISKNYIVYGVGYNTDYIPIHKRVCTVEELQELRGSKYAQSYLGNTFSSIKEDLQNGRQVLFSGTACQVAGLLSYLPKKLHYNLLTIDIVCHGVPSPALWNTYISWVERKYGNSIISTNFRNKKFGWHSCRETFLLQNGKEVVRDSYRFFLMSDTHFATRLCCSQCPFTSYKRVSDITIGDFWGWEKSHSEFCDNLGVSLLLISSVKGRHVFNAIKQYVDSISSCAEECLQPQLQKPVNVDINKAVEFQQDFETKDFSYIMKKYADESLQYKIRSFLFSLKRRFSIKK